MSAQCKDRIWIGHTSDPEQTTSLIRQWCPFPIHHIEFHSMTADKAAELLAAIVEWRVRRGGNWFRTPKEMEDTLKRIAGS